MVNALLLLNAIIFVIDLAAFVFSDRTRSGIWAIISLQMIILLALVKIYG